MKKLEKKVAITRRRKKINKLFWFVPSQQLNKLTMRQLKRYLKRHKCLICQKIFRFKSGLKTHNEDNHQKLVESSDKILNENPLSKIEQLCRGKTRNQHKPDDDNSGQNSQKMIIQSTSQTQRLLHLVPINVPGGSADGMASCLSPLERRLETPTTSRVGMVNPSCTPLVQAMGTPWGPWTRGGPGGHQVRGAPEGTRIRGMRVAREGTHVRGVRCTSEGPPVRVTRGTPEEVPLMTGIMRGSVMRQMRGASRGLLRSGTRGTSEVPLTRRISPSMRGTPRGPGSGPLLRGIRPNMVPGIPGGLRMRGSRPRRRGMREMIGAPGVRMVGMQPRMPIRGVPRGPRLGGQMRPIEIVDFSDEESPSTMLSIPSLVRLKSFGISVSSQKAETAQRPQGSVRSDSIG